MLDDRVGSMSLLGGVQLATRESQLVDNADERTRSHRGPDAQDSHADHSTSGLGDDDRRRRDIEEVAQEVGVRRPGIPIGAIMSHKADGGVEIGRSGAADVNLHEGPQRGMRAYDLQRGAAGRPTRGYHDPELNLRSRSTVSVHTRLYCAASPGAAMMPRT
jgi:hypothetical protein